jgi:GNAT superfamily N-acetyltransferase
MNRAQKGAHVEIIITEAGLADADDILALQKLAFESEARLYADWSLPPLIQTLDELRAEFAEKSVLKATCDGRIVGSVRAGLVGGTCHIGRLIVHPDYQRRGIGTRLMQAIESRYATASRYELYTGGRSVNNIRLYTMLGYRMVRAQTLSPQVTLVSMEKPGATS